MKQAQVIHLAQPLKVPPDPPPFWHQNVFQVRKSARLLQTPGSSPLTYTATLARSGYVPDVDPTYKKGFLGQNTPLRWT